MRVGLSARMARMALAEMGPPEVKDIEEIWHGLTPPYQPLFDWIAGGRAPNTRPARPSGR